VKQGILTHGIYSPLLYLVMRAAFFPLSPVPGGLVLDPLWLFLSLRGGQNRWVRFAALLPGLVIGDLLAGLDPVVIGIRVLGVLSVLGTEPRGAGPHAQWLYGTLFHGLWTAVAVDLMGFYPLGFICLTGWIQSLLWWGLGAPDTGGGPLPPLRQWIWLPLLLVAVHLVFPSSPLWPLPHMGQTSGWGLRVSSMLLLLLPWVPGLWKLRGNIRPDPERNFHVVIE